MEVGRMRCGSADDVAQFVPEFVSQARGDSAIVSECFRHVGLDERMISYFHEARSRSMAAQNSSEEMACTRPESNSSRRRVASWMDSAAASVPLCGGNESNSHAASEPRALAGKPAASCLISAINISCALMEELSTESRVMQADARRPHKRCLRRLLPWQNHPGLRVVQVGIRPTPGGKCCGDQSKAPERPTQNDVQPTCGSTKE